MPDTGPAVNPIPRRFRVSLGWVLCQQWLVMFLSFGLMVACGYAGGRPPARLLFGLGVMMSALAAFFTAGIVVAVWRFHLQPRPDGLAFGRLVRRPMLVPWADITDVRPKQVLLIGHLLLTVRGRRQPVAVPLRLDDLGGFAEAVAEYAGEDHPLTESLWERLANEGPAG